MELIELMEAQHHIDAINRMNYEIKRWKKILENLSAMLKFNGLDHTIDYLKTELTNAQVDDFYLNMIISPDFPKTEVKRKELEQIRNRIREFIQNGV
jgi:hypothetical protein